MLEEIESIAVDYFELNGFLVRKGLGLNMEMEGAETVFPSLILRNLKEESLQEDLVFQFQWFSSDIAKTRRAVVSIAGEGLLGMGNRAIQADKRLVQTLKKQLFSKQSKHFPWESRPIAEELCGHRRLVLLPLLPDSQKARSELCDKLAAKGADGVLTLRTLLDNLVQKLDSLEEARLTPLLRQLRILRQMDLLRLPQLSLFE